MSKTADNTGMPGEATIFRVRSRVQARLAVGLCALILLLLDTSHTLQAAIYACPTSEGSTIFQDRPCPIKKQKEAPRPIVQRLPFGIHESWFKVPGQAEGRAFCDRRGCECGPLERKHEGNLDRAVADALYIDGGWHRYDTSYQVWLDTPTTSSDNYLRRQEMIEAACSVMMSQQLLREYADEVAERLREQTRSAEERGFDVPAPCDRGVAQACNFYDSVLLYRRLMADAKALQVAREDTTSAGSQTDKLLSVDSSLTDTD